MTEQQWDGGKMRKCPATENKSAGVLRLQNNPFASREDVKSSSLAAESSGTKQVSAAQWTQEDTVF